MAGKGSKRAWGRIRKTTAGTYQASYPDPEKRTRITAAGNVVPVVHIAPHTWGWKGMSSEQDEDAWNEANNWLRAQKRLIDAGNWSPPADALAARLEAEQQAIANRVPTFKEYADRWISGRRNKRTGRELAPRTAEHYRTLLADYLEPTFGAIPLDQITAQAVNLWFDAFVPKTKRHQGRKTNGDTTRAHAYSLGRAIFNTATGAHGPLVGQVNPFAVRGGGTTDVRRRDDQIATGVEVATMLETIKMDHRPILLLALWCGLRYSEIAELRRSDVDLSAEVVRVRRAVADRTGGVKGPKSAQGVRDIHMPAVVVDAMRAHMRGRVTGKDGLLFPGAQGGHLKPSAFYGKPKGSGWYAARAAAGRPDLHFHDLRATGATLLAQNGATEAEIQAWLGDSTPQAAARYVRAAKSRMKKHADRMGELAARGDW